jgi:hypothetical protein
MPANIGRTWCRTTSAALAERWESARAALARLAPDEQVPVPICETNLDVLLARVGELEKIKFESAPAPSPLMLNAQDENWRLRTSINKRVDYILSKQRILDYWRADASSKLARIITKEMLERPTHRYSLAVPGPQFDSYNQARAENEKLRQEDAALQKTEEAFRRAEHYQSKPVGERAFDLVVILNGKHDAFAEYLEHTIAELQAEIAILKSKKSKRSSKLKAVA